MDPLNPDSFNHFTQRLSTGRTYHFVDQKPDSFQPYRTHLALLCLHGVESDSWYGWRYQYSVSEAQTVLWELSELGFRYELAMLDRRAIEPRVFEDQRYKDSLLSPLIRESHILRCFPFGPSEPRHLAYVPIHHASRGLASLAVRDRLPYLIALRCVMGEWDGYEKSQLGRLQTPTQNSRDSDIYYYEESITQFYVQMFFRFFGRAAIIPMYLTHNT